eukprot:m.736233 g.736233  ORF g.736233 m.736233 type:complete len:143 (-) comp58896_c0_seq9:122-550(-)
MSLQDPPHLSWLSLCCRTGAGPVLLRSHVVTVAIWGTLTLFITCYNHHGHQLIKSLPDHPTFHDFHHSHNDGNFGPFPLLILRFLLVSFASFAYFADSTTSLLLFSSRDGAISGLVPRHRPHIPQISRQAGQSQAVSLSAVW